jgi:heat shock protein HslJ
MRIFIALALTLLAAGCAPVTSAPVSLNGTEWMLTSMPGMTLVGDAKITLHFEDGSATGSAGCNQYRGTYTASGTSLTFGPIASTKRACIDNGMNAQETAYLDALSKTATYLITADRLFLRDADNTERLVYERAR